MNRESVLNEVFLFVALLLVGLLLGPVVIYFVGGQVFGEYAGQGFGDFYGAIHADLRSGAWVAVFVVLSPYLVWQLVRFSIRFFRNKDLLPNTEN